MNKKYDNLRKSNSLKELKELLKLDLLKIQK